MIRSQCFINKIYKIRAEEEEGTLHSLAFLLLHLIKLPWLSFWCCSQGPGRKRVAHFSWVTEEVQGTWRGLPSWGWAFFLEGMQHILVLLQGGAGGINAASLFSCSLVSFWCLPWAKSKWKTEDKRNVIKSLPVGLLGNQAR